MSSLPRDFVPGVTRALLGSVFQTHEKKQKTHRYQNNYVIGAGKYVINGIEKQPNAKTRTKENACRVEKFYYLLNSLFLLLPPIF